jgi:predicted Rdx family selenoprotein
VAAQLKRDLDVDAELIVGGSGEFSIWVDDAKIIEKHGGRFPEAEAIVAAVRAQKA